ncbi:10903_t:CDS:2, partial [Scutellospora calospora]
MLTASLLGMDDYLYDWESEFKPASEIDPVTQAITDLKESSSNIETTSRSSIKPNNKKFDLSRFKYQCLSNDTLSHYKQTAILKNTQKNTQPDLNIDQINNKHILAVLLSEFVIAIKKYDKNEFKADSLYNDVCAINRYFIERFKEIGPFNLHELEEIPNGTSQGADPLSDYEMKQIFEHHELNRDTPIRLFHKVFLWIGCCTAKQSGFYLDIMTSHFKECSDGGFDLLMIYDKTYKDRYYHRNTSGSRHNTPSQIIPLDKLGVIGACTDIKKYLSLRPANAEPNLFLQINRDSEGNWYTYLHMGHDSLFKVLKTICELTRIDCTNRHIVNHFLRKTTTQKLNDHNVDPQAIMNIILHRSIAGLNRYRKQNEEQHIKVANIALPAVNNILPKQILANEE